MKNILAENLLRFGVKNLNETNKKVLSESLLLEQIQQVTTALDALNTAMKAKPTFIASHQIHPSISLGYGAALCAQGGTMTTAMLPQGLIGGSGIVNTYKSSSEPLGGKPLPISINVYKNVIQGKGGLTDNYGKFASGLPDGPKIKLWGNYNGIETTAAPKLATVKSDIVAYCNNYYATGENGKFWGTNGVYAKVQGSAADYDTQIDALLKALSAMWIENSTNYRSAGAYKMYCLVS